MSKRAVVTDAKRVLLEESKSDVVGLWTVLWDIVQQEPSLAAEEARAVALTVIREALEEDPLLIAGDFADQDEMRWVFVPWRLPTEKIVSRIEQEWTALGRDPSLGEIVWFTNSNLLPITASKDPLADLRRGFDSGT